MAVSGKEAAICWMHGKQLALGNFRNHLAGAVLVGVPGDVGLRQHSYELMAVDHGQAANLMLLHGVDGLFEGIVRAHGDRLALSMLRDLGFGGFHAAGHRAHDDSDPFHTVCVAAGAQACPATSKARWQAS